MLSPQKEEPAKPKAKLARSDSQLAKDLQNEFNQDRKTKHAKTQADKKNVKKLRRLGFSEEEAINALEVSSPEQKLCIYGPFSSLSCFREVPKLNTNSSFI